ncbi:MAG: hypothetical protein IT376_03055 [Polyangiaceae bacterium]|nr:hypothetical protein [Polyangiaceae bacterium]
MVRTALLAWLAVGALGGAIAGCGGSGSGGGYFPTDDGGADAAAGGTAGTGGGASGAGGVGAAGAGGASGASGSAGDGGAAGGAGAGGVGAAGAGGGASGTGGGGTGGGGTGGGGTGGGGTGGGTGGGGTGGGGGACTNSLSCVGSPFGTICDPITKTCVECAQPADCTGTADCVSNTCVPYTTCQNSLDCPLGQVCDPAAQRCYPCLGDLDCAGGAKCIAHQCVSLTSCQSDNQCTPIGKLCDPGLGYCVDCLGDPGCSPAEHCALGTCAPDVCATGASRCEGNARASCLANGGGWGSAVACPSQTTCTEGGGGATCSPWSCTAGQTYCEGSTLVTCSADGLQRVSEVDCGATSQICSAGACTSQVCTPYSIYCDGAQVRECDSTGTSAVVLDFCGFDEYCRALPTPASCVPMVCAPDQPACDGDVLRTCNSTGSGFLSGGTSCAPYACVSGACAACPTNPVEDLRLVEVFLGATDHIVIENTGTCPVDVAGLRLVVRTSAGTADDLSYLLPSRVLAGGEQVYVTDDQSTPTDIVPSSNIYFTASTGENVLLCDGLCTATTVIDAFRHASGAAPPALPAGITFVSAPETGITSANVETSAYVRVGYSGSAPAFSAADWAVGAASRIVSDCPATAPADGSACSSLGTTCSYGAITCSCLFTWSCS